MNGPGKYDDACTQARLSTNALGAILIVLDGKHGNGFSVQVPLHVLPALPELLETVARQIRETRD